MHFSVSVNKSRFQDFGSFQTLREVLVFTDFRRLSSILVDFQIDFDRFPLAAWCPGLVRISFSERCARRQSLFYYKIKRFAPRIFPARFARRITFVFHVYFVTEGHQQSSRKRGKACFPFACWQSGIFIISFIINLPRPVHGSGEKTFLNQEFLFLSK